jgi:hypothetical protein
MNRDSDPKTTVRHDRVVLERIDGVMGGIILHVTGHLNTLELLEHCDRLIENGYTRIILDWCGRSGLSNGMICVMYMVKFKARKSGGTSISAAVAPSEKEIAMQLGCAQFITYSDTVDEAIRMLKAQGGLLGKARRMAEASVWERRVQRRKYQADVE